MPWRPCNCDNFLAGAPFTPDMCRLCWLYHNDARYTSLWTPQPGETPPPGRRANTARCIHKGNLRRTVSCETCKGSVKVKVFDCDELGECTVQKQISGIALCLACDRHVPYEC
jgi:hypothetical protein